jgi:hypothetical protein
MNITGTQLCPFLEDYLAFTQGNETPELMHLWVGLSVLAGAAEKRVWIDRGFFKIYPNLYTILVSPAGVCAKSTSMDLGSKLLKEAGYNVLEGSILKEKIIIEMCEAQKEIDVSADTRFIHSSVTYMSDELNVLLSSGTEMVKFLVDMWGKDDLYVYKTKNSGSFEIQYPYFNFLAAAVPQWFGPSLANDMASTGLLARCIFVYEEKKRGKWPEPVITPDQYRARDRCLQHLFAMTNFFGALKLSKEFDTMFREWYMSQDISPLEDYRIASYLERRTKVHILKVASLVAMGDRRSELLPIDFQRALAIFAATEKKLRTAFLIAGGNRLAPHILRVKAILEAQGGKALLKTIYNVLHTELDPTEFKTVLQTLIETEYAKVIRGDDNKAQILVKL